MARKRKNIVVMGGGTGTFTVLSSLKAFPKFDLKAIVAMSDDGGSSGVLRDELGVLPPGDVRQCLVALSKSPELIRNLMNYRFETGGLRGHSFGNLFLSALEKVSGSFEQSLAEISKIINLEGEIIPVTLDSVNLKMTLRNGAILKGERHITPAEVIQPIGIKKFLILPKPKMNPRAQAAILSADAILIGPGNLFTSLVPLYLVPGINDALKRSSAKKIFLVNLVTKFGQTDRFSIFDFVREIEKYLGRGVLDQVVYNTSLPRDEVVSRYIKRERSKPVIFNGLKKNLPQESMFISKDHFFFDQKEFLGGDFVSNRVDRRRQGDPLVGRNLIRHNQVKLGRFLEKLINR